MSPYWRSVAVSAIVFIVLLLFWMMFVSTLRWHEVAVGMVAASAGTLGNWVVKSEGFAPFHPRVGWVLLILWEPWYVLKGSLIVLRELARVLAGAQPIGQFQAVAFDYGAAENARDAAKRALFAAYITVSPDTIAVGLDSKQKLALLHQLGSKQISQLGRVLGAHP